MPAMVLSRFNAGLFKRFMILISCLLSTWCSSHVQSCQHEWHLPAPILHANQRSFQSTLNAFRSLCACGNVSIPCYDKVISAGILSCHRMLDNKNCAFTTILSIRHSNSCQSIAVASFSNRSLGSNCSIIGLFQTSSVDEWYCYVSLAFLTAVPTRNTTLF